MIVASRWLEWFEKKITGAVDRSKMLEAVHAQRDLAAQQRAEPDVQDHEPGRGAGPGARPVGGEDRVLAGRRVRLRAAGHHRPAAPPEPLGHRLQLVAQTHAPPRA